MEWEDFIDQRPDVMVGKPTFKDTRLTVEHVLRELGRGMSESDIVAGHPQLTPAHVRAAQLYAAAVLASGERLL